MSIRTMQYGYFFEFQTHSLVGYEILIGKKNGGLCLLFYLDARL